MKEIVIFCQSYTQIKSTLYVVENNSDNCSITLIILNIQGLYKFFKVINEKLYNNSINIIYIERYIYRRIKGKKIKNIFYLFLDIIRERQYLRSIHNNYFAKLKGAQIFFSSRHYADYAFYLLKKLSKSNSLVHIPDPAADLLPTDPSKPANIPELVRLVINKLIFGWDMTMGKFQVNRFLYMPDKFIRAKIDKVISKEERDEMLGDLDISKFQIWNVDDYDVFYFGHDAKNIRISRDTMKRELEEVFNILSKYFPKNRIACKYHPRRNNDKTMISTGVVLEDFIPGEFLFNENVKMYLSIYSSTIANIEKGLTISLIDLISTRDDELRRQVKNRLIKMSHTKILFPKSLDEFEKILINLKQKTTSGPTVDNTST